MTDPGALRRHDLVDVAPEAWAGATAGFVLALEAASFVTGWVERGHPAIVRRTFAGEGAGVIPLAIQLPNSYGRLRLAFAVPPDAVTPRAPVGLAEASASAPAAWSDTIDAVLALGFGEPRVYGGLLWQHVTGEPVLRETSDLDLLWQPSPERRVALIKALSGITGAPRLDGEIVLDDGAGVSWRELHAATGGRTSSVAVKTMSGVALREAREILCGTAPC